MRGGQLMLFLVFGTLACGVTSQTACLLSWFGQNCQYKCHCTNTACDINGDCFNGSKCETGWFGPACQYVDLVDPSRISGISNPQRNSNMCIGDGSTTSVSIDLDTSYYFSWMRLVFRDAGFLENITLNLMMNSTQIKCLEQNSSMFNNKTLDIHCDSQVVVNKVNLSGTGIQSLCSVHISGGRNVALKQNATQSSTYREENVFNNAEKAVDGNTSKTAFGDTCAATANDINSKWTLMFAKRHKISRFKIYNRGSNQERLKGFRIHGYDDENQLVYYYEDKSGVQEVYKVMPDSLIQNLVQVQISSNVSFFTMCEVEMYGDTSCSKNTFGRECENQCNCAKHEACFVNTGSCPSGCSRGFYGHGCKMTCPEHFYGVDCKDPCRQSCLNESCNQSNGMCLDCVPGKQGTYCSEDCQPGYFGKKCSEVCSSNCVGNCNGQTGACFICKEGYKGFTCNETCPVHYYGAGCLRNCSTNCTNQTCHFENGACVSCLSGTRGTFCERAYTATPSTENIIPLAVGVVAAFLVLVLVLVIAAFLWRRKRPNSKANQYPQQQFTEDTAHDVVTVSKTRTQKDKSESTNKESEQRYNEPYSNCIPEQTSTAIHMKDLHFFLLSHKINYFESQFEKIFDNHDATTLVALSNENKGKNRYKNICPYDHSRVCLTINTERKEGDYINASYVKGYKNKERFIASQGPNKVIVYDFVRMLWEQKVEKVVMLTRLIEEGKTKCERYWPEDKEVVFGEILVKLATTQEFTDYTIRNLTLEKKGEPSHNFTHFHFTSWPDKNVPVTPWSLVDFRQRVFQCSTSQPIVVHCSAGVGRTGTFIALHNVVQEAQETRTLNFFNTVMKLRQQRMNMIQTAEQYFFLHKAAEVALLCLNTTILSHDLRDRINFLEERVTQKSNMEVEFNSICEVCAEVDVRDTESDDNEKKVYENSQAVNKQKNRFSNILSNDLYRPVLYGDEYKKGGGYINAVLVSNFTKPDHHILSQLPLPTTITDFWHMVAQYQVSLVVAFELDLMATDLTIGDYLPSRKNEPVKFGSFTVKIGQTTAEDFGLQQTLILTSNASIPTNKSTSQKTEEHHLVHLKCTCTDLNLEKMLPLVKKINSFISTKSGKTLFVCRNGATYSGLVYVLSLLLDRMNNDNCVTIPLVVGATKAIRPHVIPTVEQYRFLYKFVSWYQESTSVYNNFNNPNQTTSSTDHKPTNKPSESDAETNVYANLL